MPGASRPADEPDYRAIGLLLGGLAASGGLVSGAGWIKSSHRLYLIPFSKQLQLTWSGQWALNAWPNFVITGMLIGMMFIFARQRGFSPLEMVSSKADAIFVRALRTRFPLRSAN